MPLVKNGAVVADPWGLLADDAEAPKGGHVIVSLQRLLAEGEALLSTVAGLGLVLEPADDPEAARAFYPRLQLVAVRFPAFRDGRGFSTAYLLRDRLGFTAELRAIGDVLEDQIKFMLRVGFDAFDINKPNALEIFERAAKRYSVVYQRSADGREIAIDARESVEQRLARLNAAYRNATPSEIIKAALQEWPNEIALVSSFGAESAALIALASDEDKALPVLFLETDRHFQDTLDYRDTLAKHFGLTNLINLVPDAAEVAREDTDGKLSRRSMDACCDLRKVRPLARGLTGYAAWITGRKRFQGGSRVSIPPFEHSGQHFKVNPFANISPDEIEAIYVERELPRHPLTAEGYTSIGCWPCTKPPIDADDSRSGRWEGTDKIECGIHVAL